MSDEKADRKLFIRTLKVFNAHSTPNVQWKSTQLVWKVLL